jgi:hypothetical protein
MNAPPAVKPKCPLREAAESYHGVGWNAIPVNVQKKPVVDEWGHWKNRRQTEAELQSLPWGRAHGIALILWPAADFVVVDFDGPHADEAWRGTGIVLPETAKNHTRSGGTHLIYRMPESLLGPDRGNGGGPRREVRLAKAACDCKKDGDPHPCGVDLLVNGYFLVPPSPGYREDPDYPFEPSGIVTIPQAVLELQLPEAPRTRPAAPGEVIPGGQRNDTLARIAGKMRHAEMTTDELTAALQVVNMARCDPPLPEAEVRGIAQSIGRYPPGGSPAESDPEEPVVAEWPTLDPLALYGLAGDIVREVGPLSEADPVAILVNILAAFGNMVGRDPGFTVESTRHHLNMFGVLVGATAGGRKGQSWSTPRRLAEMVDEEWARASVKEGLSSGEGLVFNVRDASYKTTTDKVGGIKETLLDPGVADKRLLVMEGEFAQVLRVMQREGNTLSPTLRRAWDGAEVLSPMTKNNVIKATGAHISVLGHITVEELLLLLGQAELSNGWANRFLWCCVRRSKYLPRGVPIPAVVLDRLAERLGAAVANSRGVGDIERTPEADVMWENVYQELSSPRPGLVGAMTARSEPQAMRLACIYALLDKTTRVRKEHLLAGLALLDYAADSVQFVFGRRLGDPVAEKCLESIRAAGESGLNVRELHQVFGNHQTADRLAAALQSLVALGLVEARPEKTGGRRATRYFAKAERREQS